MRSALWTVDVWSEDILIDETIKTAIKWRWAVTHFRYARTRTEWRTAIQGHKGWPDLALARSGVLLLRELKAATGRLSPEQVDWARQITGDPHWREPARHGATPAERRGLLFDVWRPRDWQPLIIPTLTERQP